MSVWSFNCAVARAQTQPSARAYKRKREGNLQQGKGSGDKIARQIGYFSAVFLKIRRRYKNATLE